MKYRRIVVTRHGGPDVLRLLEGVKQPAPDRR